MFKQVSAHHFLQLGFLSVVEFSRLSGQGGKRKREGAGKEKAGDFLHGILILSAVCQCRALSCKWHLRDHLLFFIGEIQNVIGANPLGRTALEPFLGCCSLFNRQIPIT